MFYLDMLLLMYNRTLLNKILIKYILDNMNITIGESLMKKYITAESVTEGHPDKICDQISDAILDAIMLSDPNGRVACEVCVTTNRVIVMGEITTTAEIDIDQIVRATIREIGYNDPELEFDSNSCEVEIYIDKQSEDIARGVDECLEEKRGKERMKIGAGDQGIMYGYATDETVDYMPYPIMIAHKLAMQIDRVRKAGVIPYLYPDGKTQVTVEYEEDIPTRVDTIVCSVQHSEKITHDDIKQDIIEFVVRPIIPQKLIDSNTKILVNPTGRFVIGGPKGDCGLTGRKIMVDTYGGCAHHGGGAFSGKDCTKVDRTAAYMARYLAKNIVAAGLARKCEIQLSYAIGVAKPISIYVETFNTGKVQLDSEIAKVIQESFDLSPNGIIDRFKLRRPIYKHIASYGHFGREDLDLPWERLDCVELFRKMIKGNIL